MYWTVQVEAKYTVFLVIPHPKNVPKCKQMAEIAFFNSDYLHARSAVY